MENNNSGLNTGSPRQERFEGEPKASRLIPVVEELAVISREVIETGKVRIRKMILEEQGTVIHSVVSEFFHIERVPVHQVQDTAPPLRYEGDVMIIPVTRKFTVAQKCYNIVEGLHVTKQVTETHMVQEITLLKETVKVERTSNPAGSTDHL